MVVTPGKTVEPTKFKIRVYLDQDNSQIRGGTSIAVFAKNAGAQEGAWEEPIAL